MLEISQRILRLTAFVRTDILDNIVTKPLRKSMPMDAITVHSMLIILSLCAIAEMKMVVFSMSTGGIVTNQTVNSVTIE